MSGGRSLNPLGFFVYNVKTCVQYERTLVTTVRVQQSLCGIMSYSTYAAERHVRRVL